MNLQSNGHQPGNLQNNLGGPRSPFHGEIGKIILRCVGVLILIVVGILGVYLASVIISAIGGQCEGLFRYISRLFREARYMLDSARGFSAFVQLMLIAGFIGWVIRRFTR